MRPADARLKASIMISTRIACYQCEAHQVDVALAMFLVLDEQVLTEIRRRHPAERTAQPAADRLRQPG
jgi:hypothetical protein